MQTKTFQRATKILGMCQSTLSLENKLIKRVIRLCQEKQIKYGIRSQKADKADHELKQTLAQLKKQLKESNQNVRELLWITEVDNNKVIKTLSDFYDSIKKELRIIAKKVELINRHFDNIVTKKEALELQENQQKGINPIKRRRNHPDKETKLEKVEVKQQSHN